MTTVLITGAIGFVGSHIVEHILKSTDWNIVAMCRMNYAGDMHRILDAEYIKGFENRIRFVYQDLQFQISPEMAQRIGKLDYIIHLAANSHVDRSITHPVEFFRDNVLGTVNMLEFARHYHPQTRFINFSTDEVFGAAPDDYNYKEDDRYRPSNPYSAAKAGAACAGHSYFVTYGLPVITTYTMNIFGERQNSEKLVSRSIKRIISEEPMTIHCKIRPGSTTTQNKDGLWVTRDANDVTEIGQRHWLHARNAADALVFLLRNGEPGEHYNVVGDTELTNDEMVRKIAAVLDKEVEMEYVDFHACRPGHDRRYALDGTKLKELGWIPPVDFDTSLKKTVEWSLKHDDFLKA